MAKMKPLPNINDAADMIRRGQLSALYFARREAMEILRDSFAAMQSGVDFGPQLETNATIARDAAIRLLVLAAMRNELDGPK